MAKRSHDEIRQIAAAPVSDEAMAENQLIYTRIGQFITAWATVESLFVAVLRETLCTTKTNAAVIMYSFQSSRAKGRLLDALAHDNLTADERGQLADLLKRFKAPTKLRNELAHSSYDQDSASGILDHYSTANMDDYSGGEPVSRTDIDKAWHNRMEQMTLQMHRLNLDLWDFLGGLKKRPKSPPAESGGSPKP